MEEKQFKCTGDCFKCQPLQRQYCAAQWSYNGLRIIEQMQSALAAMQVDVAEIKEKVDAIQGNEASLFDPTKEDMSPKEISETSDIAQSGDGAESRIPKNHTKTKFYEL